MQRRNWMFAAAGAAGLGLVAGVGRIGAQGTGSAPRRLAVTARKFEFSVPQITAMVGESLLLEISSVDFVHGFSLPQLGLRADAPPGTMVALLVPNLRAGRYIFLCDNFCGEAHDKMTGTLVVS
jgi:cytochrome c oxidase subunit II